MGLETVVSSSDGEVMVALLLAVASASACQAARVALEIPLPPVVERAIGKNSGISGEKCHAVVGVSG